MSEEPEKPDEVIIDLTELEIDTGNVILRNPGLVRRGEGVFR